MSPVGTFRTWRDVRVESAMRFKADIAESNIPAWAGDAQSRASDGERERDLVIRVQAGPDRVAPRRPCTRKFSFLDLFLYPDGCWPLSITRSGEWSLLKT